MGDAVLLRTWNINGLPNDAVSSENGILCTRAERYSLCIDPQQQANKWIKNMEKDNKLVLLKLTTPNFLRSVSAAVRIGQPCLVEDIEEALDPALDPLLLH
jgi:dynein heavy chain